MSANQLWLAAEAAFDRRDWASSRAGYEQALAAESAHVPSLIGLSTLLSRVGEHRASHELAMRAWVLRPRDPALIFGLAQRLHFFSEFDALEACLSHPSFAQQAPAQAVARATVMLSSIGAHKAAVALADAAGTRYPNDAALLFVRGNLQFFSGSTGEADRCYEASLAADPRMYQNTWMQAALRTQTTDNHHVARLRGQLQAATPGQAGEAYLQYALHKELHDLGDYEGAWRALERGNLIKRQMSQYTHANTLRHLEEMRRIATPTFLATSSRDIATATPIFIVGMHRSGTTLLERMLAGHSAIGDAGETSAFDAQLNLAADRSPALQLDAALPAALQSADFDAIASGYERHVPWLSRGKPFFTEKLPTNFWNVGFIAKALPNAKVLHLMRDPLDTCFSNLRTFFSGAAAYSYVQEELGAFYLAYRQMMEHWRSVLPGMVLDVDYHALVEDPEAIARQVACHCGLDYENSMVHVTRTEGRVATASAYLARQGVRKDRGGAWANYRKHLGPLQEVLAPLYR